MNPKKRIKDLLHIKSKKKFKILFSRSNPYRRGRVPTVEEATVNELTPDLALDQLRDQLLKQGTNDFTIISVESEE
jgi:hypothetical protein